jgi:hypothetical protein
MIAPALLGTPLRAFAAEEHGQMGSVSLAFTVGSV